MELTISRKQIRTGLKMGLTREGFCSKYGCEPLAFDEHLTRIYGNDQKALKGIFSEIKANEKRAHRNRQRQGHDDVVMPQVEQAQAQELPSELDALKQREEILSEGIIALEVEHRTFAEKLHDRRKVLREIKAEVKELQRCLTAKCDEFTNVVAEANGLVQEMNRISDERRPKVAELADVRQRIAELSVVTLCVYNNGTIAPIDGGEVMLDTAGSDKLYQTLLDEEFCAELRIKDVRALAEAIMVVQNSECDVDLLFDRPEVEEAYKAYLDVAQSTEQR